MTQVVTERVTQVKKGGFEAVGPFCKFSRKVERKMPIFVAKVKNVANFVCDATRLCHSHKTTSILTNEIRGFIKCYM